MVATAETVNHRRLSGEALHMDICVVEEIHPTMLMRMSPEDVGRVVSIAMRDNEVIALWCNYAMESLFMARLLWENEYPDG